MIDAAAEKTEKKLKQIENRLKKLYKESEADVTKAWTEYITAQDDKIERLKEAYGNAKDFGTAEDVKRIGKELGVARAERTLQNQYYKDMVAETTRKLAGVNQQALAYLNGQMFWVYAENFNQAAKDADKVGFRFDMVDEATVRRRVMDGNIKLPKKKLSIPKDMRWNTKQLNSAVLQGIVNGESMDKIAARIYPIVDNNAAAAIRNARTMVTGAQNQGRQDSYKQMADMGIVLKKVWMATPDERTRESHLLLDGEEVEYNKEFSNGLMFPGDPGGAPEEVYNCRCTMVTDIVGFRKADGRIERIAVKDTDDFHEQQIADEAQRRAKEEAERQEKMLAAPPKPGQGRMMGRSADGYSNEDVKEMERYILDDGESGEVYELMAEDMSPVNEYVRRGHSAYYTNEDNEVHFHKNKVIAGDDLHPPYETHFHEYGHWIDYNAMNPNDPFPFSLNYKNADGKTLGEVVTDEWGTRIAKMVEEKQLSGALKMFDADTSIGMGADGYMYQELANLRKTMGWKRDHPEYKRIRGEIEALRTDSARRDYYEKHFDLFRKAYPPDYYYRKQTAIKDFCREMKSKYSLSARGDLSDMFETYSVRNGGPDFPFGAGHGSTYTKRTGAVTKETFAEMFSAEIANKESLELIQEYLPESYNMFKTMLGEIKKEVRRRR